MANELSLYRHWIQNQPCIVCGHRPCEAHHPRHNVGLAMRAHDSRLVSLCSRHHTELHGMSGHFRALHRQDVRDMMDAAGERLRTEYKKQHPEDESETL